MPDVMSERSSAAFTSAKFDRAAQRPSGLRLHSGSSPSATGTHTQITNFRRKHNRHSRRRILVLDGSYLPMRWHAHGAQCATGTAAAVEQSGRLPMSSGSIWRLAERCCCCFRGWKSSLSRRTSQRSSRRNSTGGTRPHGTALLAEILVRACSPDQLPKNCMSRIRCYGRVHTVAAC